MQNDFGPMFIQECQQNRYPLLFIDRMLEFNPGISASAVKNFSYNEWFFPAHFPDEPSVPGFVQLECLTQTFIMTFLTLDEHKGKKTAFSQVKNVKFLKKIVPGDSLRIEASLETFKFGVASGYAKGFVDEQLACSAELVVVLPDVVKMLSPRSSVAGK